MKILVSGTAGFIGFYVAKILLEAGHEVIGLDNINNYYDVNLKYGRLKESGIIPSEIVYNTYCQSNKYPNYRFIRLNLEDKENLFKVFEQHKFDKVCHLAAQPGVRYSIENPYAYINSNIVGFLHILEGCRHYKVQHLVFASSSSVYGNNNHIPFSEKDRVDEPVSLYAATKRSNELMSYTYAHLYGFQLTGLRFFTVYGPWGRPDMAPMLFADAITQGKPIQVFNNGDLYRDFTYVEDIAEGVQKVLLTDITQSDKYKLYNIGCSQPVHLMDFIHTLEIHLGKKAKMEFLPMQAGDVYKTYADTTLLERDFNYKPSISLQIGIKEFVNWYISDNNPIK
jgi:UDP-glucuronate 4-epimerase